MALQTKSKEMHFKDEIFGVFFNYYLYYLYCSALWAPPTRQSDHQQLMQNSGSTEESSRRPLQELNSGLTELGLNLARCLPLDEPQNERKLLPDEAGPLVPPPVFWR